MGLIEDTTIYVRVTNRCNSKCGFCYRDSLLGKDLTIEKIKRIIDKVVEFGFKRIGFLGGEIFLRKDLREIMDYAHKRKLLIIVASNGSLVKDKEIKLLNKYVAWFGIPLDGSTKDKSLLMRNSFDQFNITLKLLKKFKRKKPKFKVRIFPAGAFHARSAVRKTLISFFILESPKAIFNALR